MSHVRQRPAGARDRIDLRLRRGARPATTEPQTNDGPSRPLRRSIVRAVAFLSAGMLAVPALAGCASEDDAGKPLAGPEIAPAGRELVADGGTLRWAVDDVP